MGIALPANTGYLQWRDYIGPSAPNTMQDYEAWLRSNNLTPQQFIDRYGQPGGVQPSDLINPLTGLPNPSPGLGNIPVPGAPGGGLGQPPATPMAGPPQYLPPTLSMPPAIGPRPPDMRTGWRSVVPMDESGAFGTEVPLSNGMPMGGLGRPTMPSIRDRAMGTVLQPFTQPNWGLGQVDTRYLTQQMPLAGGATPQGIVMAPPQGGLGMMIPPEQGAGITMTIPKNPRMGYAK